MISNIDIQQLGKNAEMTLQHAYCTTLGVKNRNDQFPRVKYYHKKEWTTI